MYVSASVEIIRELVIVNHAGKKSELNLHAENAIIPNMY